MHRRTAVGLVEEPEYVPASTVLKSRPFRKVPKTEIVFSEKSRRNFVTGFHKRKEYRKKRAREEEKVQHKKEVAEKRRQKVEDLKKTNPKVYQKLTKMLRLDENDEGEDREDIEGSPTDVQEFVVDDKVVTTTITPFSMGDKMKDEEEEVEEEQMKQGDDFGFDLKAPKPKNRRGRKSKFTPKRPKR